MKIGDLTSAECRRRLRGGGLRLRTGRFLFSIGSDLPEIAAPILTLYRDFATADEEFADFHVRLTRRHSLFRRLATLDVDGVPRFGPFDRRAALAHLEWGLNWCVSRDGYNFLTLHAAVVERERRAVILAGRAGAGKSTLAAALLASGWRHLADELALIHPRTCDVEPLVRPICLKDKSIDLVRAMVPDAVFGPRCPSARKGVVVHMRPPPAGVARANEAATPAWLVFVRHEAQADLRFDAIAKHDAMRQAVETSFNYKLLGERGFETLTRLVDMCDCRTLVYGDVHAAVRAIDDALRLGGTD